MGSRTSKKSSRETCFGTTQRVSMSAPGPCTPNRYDPKVKIFPPAILAACSDNPLAMDTWRTNFFTRAATRPSTISLKTRKENQISEICVSREEFLMECAVPFECSLRHDKSVTVAYRREALLKEFVEILIMAGPRCTPINKHIWQLTSSLPPPLTRMYFVSSALP